jgi:hypothetical protein
MNKIRLVITIAFLLLVLSPAVKAAGITSPIIGAITVGACAITINFTDDVALDLQATTVVMRNGGEGEVTSDFKRYNIGDGTTAGSIILTCLKYGVYAIDICVYDKAGNKTCETRPATILACAPPYCGSVNPASGLPGQTLDVTILGENTGFNETTKVFFSCPGITVNSTSIVSPAEIVANIKINDNAELGSNCDVIVSNADLCTSQITCTYAFRIAPPPSCVSVEPSLLHLGATTDVIITLDNIYLTEKSIATDNVSFGCTGVTVNSATVNSGNEIKANIAIADTAQSCTGDVTIELEDIVLICKGAISCCIPPCIITVSPNEMRTGLLLGRVKTLTITGLSCSFDDTSTVTISGGVKVLSTEIISSSELRIKTLLPPVIMGGKGNKTVTVQTGDVSVTAALTVTGPFGR